MKFAAPILALLLVACTSTGVVTVGDDTYMIGKRSAQAGFGPPVKTQGAVYEEANAFCEQQQKKVETVKLDVTNSGFGKPGAVDLTFRCVDSGNAVEASASGQSPADTVVNHDMRGDAAAASGPDETSDLYAEILKLDDLRQRGLITDEEYEQEKKELLESN